MTPKFVFDPPPTPAAPIIGLDASYPVARIFCVGRNYEDHAKEMGHTVDREKPFYFSKSSTALRHSEATLPYPPGTDNYHFEMELVVAIGAPAFKIAPAQALSAVFGYACGLDMTRRDLQLSERAKQRPWTLGKDVEASAPVSAIARAAAIGHPTKGAITLRQNGQSRQSSDISQMVWSVPEIIAHLSGFYHLGPGDLIFTGTPAGVGPVEPGDVLEGAIEGVGALTVKIGERR
jgi:fumarylpyruvate hydrolase